MRISHGVESVHAWYLWEATGRFRGPKQPYTVNIMQARVFAGASSLWPVRGVTRQQGAAQAGGLPVPPALYAAQLVASPTLQAGQDRSHFAAGALSVAGGQLGCRWEQPRRGDQRLKEARGNQPGRVQLKKEDQSPGAAGGEIGLVVGRSEAQTDWGGWIRQARREEIINPASP